MLPAPGNLLFTGKRLVFQQSMDMLGCCISERTAPTMGHPLHIPRQHTLIPPQYTLAHGWAQPGLLYPQTLFMWHIYSKDWNN